jgi:hypothetical protein
LRWLTGVAFRGPPFATADPMWAWMVPVSHHEVVRWGTEADDLRKKSPTHAPGWSAVCLT